MRNCLKGKLLYQTFFIFWILTPIALPAQKPFSNVSVDFARPVNDVKSMSGFLHSVEPNEPPDDLIFPLKPKQWRISNSNQAVYPRIRRSGARIQLVLSDFWGYTGLNTNRPAPFRDYPQFENFVRSLAKNYGAPDVIWDIWNEPEDARLPYWKRNFQQFCETYLRAYRILREELGPDAQIGGPSFSRYDKNLLGQFLDFCKANGCEVNFLSWHELDDSNITGIPGRLDEARSLFVNNSDYAALKIKEIQINEIVGSNAQYNPGAIIGYFYYLEKGKADGASKACWENSKGESNCYNNTLDGLLRQDDLKPTAAWHTYKIYADGVDSRVAGETTNPLVAALASARSDRSDKVQVIIGYFKEKTAAPQKINVLLDLKNLPTLSFFGKSKTVRIRIEKIRNTGEQAIRNSDFILQKDFALASKSLKITLNNIALNEAYLVTATKPPPK